MSVTASGLPGHVAGRGPVRRVRHEVRDGLAVIAFSAAASWSLAFALLLVVKLGNQG